ncbi:hypothetical protein RND81_06G196600 [Saponaria officinalis]|uniref:Ty3 transposon capsid-like protein domain-containing protein n=1 Tax=Saponaria officinalis TaxID=3572 RepID=A0AAW1KC93_SAPOF
MENQLQHLQSQLAEQSSETQNLKAQFAEMMSMMKNIQEVLQPNPNSPNKSVNSNHSDSNSKSLGYLPRIEFPVFDGSNSSLWLKKCARYFSLCRISDAQKVDLAALNMIGKAELWVISYLAVHKGVDWDTFVVDLMSRFRDDMSHNIVEKFNRLQQTVYLDSYIDEFEGLKGVMLLRNPSLPDAFFLDSFIGSLKSSLKSFVKAFKPTCMAEAIEYARLQEESLAAVRSSYAYTKPGGYSLQTHPLRP